MDKTSSVFTSASVVSCSSVTALLSREAEASVFWWVVLSPEAASLETLLISSSASEPFSSGFTSSLDGSTATLSVASLGSVSSSISSS